MAYAKSIVFGAVAGVAAAAIWTAITYFTGYEVGWVAWGIGALVGVAVRYASRPEVAYTGDAAEDTSREIRAESDQIGHGIIAAVVAAAAVLLGKYLAFMLLIGNISAADFGEELTISYVADEVVEEFIAEGREVSWPAGVDPQAAAAEADYPPDVWAEALQRWQSMSPDERARFEDAASAMLAAMIRGDSGSAWLSTFGMMDFLWFGLAAWTAFKLGASGSEE